MSFFKSPDWHDTRQRRVEAVCRGRLARLPVAGHPALRVRVGLEGYRDYVFGARAGPSLSVTHLFHELAHAAQFGAESFRTRGTAYGYRFKMRRIRVLGDYYDNPATSSATDRELQTVAFQIHLLQAAGKKCSPMTLATDLCSAMRFMPDWVNVPGGSDKSRLALCVKRVLAFYRRAKQTHVVAELRGWLDATERRLKRRPQVQEADDQMLLAA